MGKVIMSGIVPNMTVPVTGILLSSIAEGSIVKLNESGSPVEFYVAKHNYESTLNGAGRTLLFRKHWYSSRVWKGNNRNNYATSDIDTWLNSDYKSLFDYDVQEFIGSTKFYYTPGEGNNTVSTLERAIFLLSVTEFGRSASYANIEGAKLDISSSLIEDTDWTRSPNTNNTYEAYWVSSNGNTGPSLTVNSQHIHPVFTLPSNSLFDKNTLILKGVV